jgi:hypothetical protein
LNKYIGEGNAIYIDKVFQSKHIKVHVLGAPEKGRTVFIQIVKEEGRSSSPESAQGISGEAGDPPWQIFNGLIKYFGAVDTKMTLAAGTNSALSQERCFDIPVLPDKNHMLLHIWQRTTSRFRSRFDLKAWWGGQLGHRAALPFFL